jgi:cysteine desulfurase
VSQSRIYLDHAATAPLLPEAREAMSEALSRWHNPSSPHAEGRAAKAVLEDARARAAAALGWKGKVIFTSGATEALRIALRRATGGRRFVSAVEHDAVLRVAPEALSLPVGPDGMVDPAAIEGDHPIVAIQHANNETGILQPLARLNEAVREKGGILVADCAQTAGKLPLPDAGMIAFSAHKFGGPPGVGALLVSDLRLIEATGGQEQGYRAGTENIPGILGMIAALEAGREWMERARQLRDGLEHAILDSGGEVIGAAVPRIPTIGAYRMPGIPSNAQLIQFDMAGIAVSAGSACSSGSLKPSRVLAAMAMPETIAREVVRVSIGRDTGEREIDRFASVWARMAAKRRAA